MRTNTIKGTYGSGNTPCEVLLFIPDDGAAGTWYCVEDSVNANFTFEDLEEHAESFGFVDVEMVTDSDCCTAQDAIQTEEELMELIEE